MDSLYLPNGTKALFKRQPGSNAAAVLFAFNVGSVNEQPHLRGVSHFLEHMMFKGTKRFPRNALSNEIQAMGGDPNAFTTFEMTAYIAEVPREQFNAKLFDLWLDALRFPQFQDLAFETEKKVVLEEISMKLDSPARRTWDLLRELIFTKHRYGVEIKGYPETITPLTPNDMRGYWAQYYRPDNLTIIITGDFELSWLKELLTETVVPWQIKESLIRDEPEPEPEQREPLVKVYYADVNHVYVKLGFRGPTFGSRHQLPLNFALDALASGRSSRLYQALVAKGIAQSVSFTASIAGRDPGMLDLSVLCSIPKLPEVFKVVGHELNRFLEQGPTEQEVAKLKNHYEKDFISTNEDAMGLGMTIAMFESSGEVTRFDSYLEDVEAVSPRAVIGSAATYLRPESAALLLYAPNEARSEGYEQLYQPQFLASLLTQKAAVAKPTSPREFTRITLNAGPSVLCDRFPRWPIFCAAVAFQGGLREESYAHAGMTSLLLNVLLRASDDTGQPLTTKLEELGGSLYPLVDLDYCGFFLTGLTKNFTPVMELLAAILGSKAVTPENLLLEQANTIARIRREQDNLPLLTTRFFRRGYYRNHPYGIPHPGTLESIPIITSAMLEDWRARVLNRNRAYFAFSGRYELTAAIEAADQMTLKFNARMPPAIVQTEVEPFITLKRETMMRDKHQANFILGFPGPAGVSPERYGMSVLTTDLSAFGNKMWRIMRDEKGLCYLSYAANVFGRDCGHTEIYVGTSPDREEEAVQTILEILTEWRDEEVDGQEFARAKAVLKGRALRAFESVQPRIASLLVAEAHGLSEDHLYRYAQKIERVDLETYQRLRREYIKPEQGFLAVVKPRST